MTERGWAPAVPAPPTRQYSPVIYITPEELHPSFPTSHTYIDIWDADGEPRCAAPNALGSTSQSLHGRPALIYLTMDPRRRLLMLPRTRTHLVIYGFPSLASCCLALCARVCSSFEWTGEGTGRGRCVFKRTQSTWLSLSYNCPTFLLVYNSRITCFFFFSKLFTGIEEVLRIAFQLCALNRASFFWPRFYS